jgi:hypothetical protein
VEQRTFFGAYMRDDIFEFSGRISRVEQRPQIVDPTKNPGVMGDHARVPQSNRGAFINEFYARCPTAASQQNPRVRDLREDVATRGRGDMRRRREF